MIMGGRVRSPRQGTCCRRTRPPLHHLVPTERNSVTDDYRAEENLRGFSFTPEQLAKVNAKVNAKLNGVLEDEQPAALTTLESFAPSPLNVHVDIVDLLNHFDGDEARAFDLIGKLKDLLA